MVVNQKAIRLWPYLDYVVVRINQDSDRANVEALMDVFLDAGKLVTRIRRDVTLNMMREQLDYRLRAYRREIKEVALKREKLQNPVGKHGKPLAASTLGQYASCVKCWPFRRERLKREIREKLHEIQALSNRKGKTITRGGVSLTVLNGGRYPVKVAYRTGENAWKKIR